MPGDEKDWEMLSNAVVETSERVGSVEEELKSLKLKFKTFFKIYLESLPQEKAQEIFKQYQKESFRK